MVKKGRGVLFLLKLMGVIACNCVKKNTLLYRCFLRLVLRSIFGKAGGRRFCLIRSVVFGKVVDWLLATFLKITILRRCLLRFAMRSVIFSKSNTPTHYVL